MGQIYYCQFDALVLASDVTQDVWAIMAGTTRAVKLHGWELTSAAIAAELIDLTLIQVSAVGSGGTGATETAADMANTVAASAAVTTENTTPSTPVAGGGLMAWQWEQLGPVGHVWTPEMRPVVTATDGFALVCGTAVTPTLSGWLCWEEL